MESHTDREIDWRQIEPLLSKLSSTDGFARQQARQSLAEMGPGVTDLLVRFLKGPSRRVRWRAAKGLAEIGGPSAAPALVEALVDNDPGVRWLAAEALVRLREHSLEPLFGALEERGGSLWLRQGAHHVLAALADGPLRDTVAPVVDALEGPEPSMAVVTAAKRARAAG